MTNRVFITGLGVVSAIGIGKDAFWNSTVEGKSGIKKITFFETSHLRSHIAGEITDFDPLKILDKKEIKDTDRVTHLALTAVDEAIKDSNISLSDDCALVVGTGLGGISTDNIQHKVYYTKGYRFVSPLTIPMGMYNATECHISKRYGIMGAGYTISTACASGLNAIGEGFRLIKEGYAQQALCGGTDATLSESIFCAWCAMRILSRRNDDPQGACRPYSKDRDGMVLGEGAGFVVLESEQSVIERSAKTYCEIVGYGLSHDANHITAPDVRGQAIAIKKALKFANIQPSEVDYINCHGTGTLLNDKVETDSIKNVFGEHAYKIPMSAIKPLIGHTLGASGAIGLIATCLAIKHSVIPPTINYTEPDPECDLDYTPNKARQKDINFALCNAFGFGGNNAVIVLRR
ncbi:MAG TPA: beta-ketoacyl-[acyl-carrier-protein] synthase family protein [Nitrospirae bacterium]|nr:beta-ketoacyl-[acyl-carrier-protein] synthase family protein [Nitrospirota bacterium]